MQGNLFKCYDFWKYTLMAPESVLNIISNGYVLPFKDQPPRRVFKNHSNCVRYEQFFDDSIKDLVADRCVKPVQEVPHVCNPLSVVCSRKGKLRLVLDLCYVNGYLWKCSFKYEDLCTVLSMFNLGDYVITFDLKSGYHHVDINEEHWRYLGFYWKKQFYVFKVLPFGLSTACYAFTKLLRPLVRYWRSKGIRAVLYIDDGIVAFSALELAAGDSIVQVREDISEAGLTINVHKSCFSPSQRGVWLGFVLDFEKGRKEICIEEEKMAALIVSIDGILASQQMVHVRALASIVGQIVSMSRAIGYLVRLFTRHLYATVSRRFTWNSYVFLNGRVKAELEFWKASIHHLNGHSIWFASSAVRVAYSDASGLGYGGVVVEHADKVVHG